MDISPLFGKSAFKIDPTFSFQFYVVKTSELEISKLRLKSTVTRTPGSIVRELLGTPESLAVFQMDPMAKTNSSSYQELKLLTVNLHFVIYM